MCDKCYVVAGRYVPADVMNIEGALYFCTFFMARALSIPYTACACGPTLHAMQRSIGGSAQRKGLLSILLVSLRHMGAARHVCAHIMMCMS